MNRDIYRLVFNEERKAWIAVAEIVRGRGKKASRRRLAAVALGLAVAVAGSYPVLAAGPLPTPSSGARPFVFSGSVQGGQPTVSGTAMTITQISQAAGLNWASFDIHAGHTVNFNHVDPNNTTYRTLNNIWSLDPSRVNGAINSRGQVYLFNQNGILFGNGAQVNVGGLVASALNLSESMAARLLNNGLPTARGDSLEFAWDGSAAGFNAGFVTVEAGAAIRTPSGGRVVLIAPKTVENLGLIEGGAGAEAILAAGGKVILTAPDDPALRGLLVETQSFVGTDALGNSVRLDGSVTNKGDGVANSDNGRIKVGAGGTVSLAALAVNQKGIINATQAVNLNGTTILVSGTTETDRLTINQRGDKAEIDWVSGFDVGAGKTVEFVQSSTGAVAYNHVHDADRIAADGSVLNVAGRSHIDGTLKANGQLLLINEKGIDFGATARVSANNFVASALGINPDMVTSGLLMQDGVSARAFYLNKTPAADSPAARLAALDVFRLATINVGAGAKIDSASNGYVILAGARVSQAGTITTPKGQTLLAAGADVYLKPAYAQALRGFSAEVNPLYTVDTASANAWIALSRGADANAVINAGDITAALGNITLVGHEITQAGTLTATTSTTANGSIRLLARDQVNGSGSEPLAASGQRKLDANGIAAYTQGEGYNIDNKANEPLFTTGQVGGTLSFAAGSATQVLLDGGDGKTLASDQTLISSSIEAVGKQIAVAGNAGATVGAVVEAKGGSIQFRAIDFFDLTTFAASDVFPVSKTAGAPAGVGIFVGDGARIDASGAVAQKSAADLFIEVELRGDEFANNPVQRNGKLRGEKAWVDIRDAVSIADLSGWIGKVNQSVAEKAAAGGTISLRSAGSVIVKQGADIDVSGGQVNYAAGTVKESRAVTLGGQSYKLKDAPVSATYAGMMTVTRQESAYTEGKSAGTVELSGNSLAVDGNLVANTTVGTRQRSVGNPAADRYAIPLGGQLIVKDAGQHFALADRDTASEAEKIAAYTQAQIAFVKGAATAAAGLAAGDTAGPRLELSQSLVASGFSRFDVQSDGRIDIPADVALNLAAGGSFKAAGRQVYVAGDISVPGGSISLSTRDMSAAGDFPTSVDARHSILTLADGASLSTAGLWLNDFLDGATTTSARAINGGGISLNSAYDLDLRTGSSVAVSGGGRVKSDGKLEAGNAGTITLTTGGVNSTGLFDFAEDGDRRDASLFLDGTLSAYALGKGGTLAINTSAIRFGTPFAQDSRNWSRAERLTADQVGAAFDADFLNRGGFYNFSFVGRDGVTVGDGVRLAPTPANWSLARIADYRYRGTGSQLGDFAQSLVLHSDLRSAPTSMALATRSLTYGDLLVGDNAYIGVSPQGSISLESQAQLTVLGTLEASAGTISLSRPANTQNNTFNKLPIGYTEVKQSESIYLGPDSQLLAGGTTVLTAATRAALEAGVSADMLRSQYRYKGSVLDGGTVKLDAGMGYLITRVGGLIDVSGATDALNTATAIGSGVGYPLQTLGSAGGSVSLVAREGMLLDGSYKAEGGANALAGAFSLRFTDALDSPSANPWDLLPAFTGPEADALRSQRVLTLYRSADESVEPRANLWPSTVDATAYLAGGATLDPVEFNGKAALDLAPLHSAGFGSWYLGSQDAMRFSGTVAATVNNQLRLDANSFSAASDASRLSLKAAAVQIGSFSEGGTPAAAGIGAAEATIEARDIGLVGAFSWNGFGSSRFISSGELHFDSVTNSVALRPDGRLFNGQMNASGYLELSAARLSPATYSDFRVDLLADPAGSIKITRPTDATADVSLSPAGRIEFAAATIDHQGTVTAPLGEIVFTAPGGSVTLGSGSLSSVAADRDLLFGNTIESGTQWRYSGVSWIQGNNAPNASGIDILTAPAKSIRIDAADSTVAAGARLDLSGGGEALAWEFTAGPGGKTDVLSASAATTFAILPNWNGFSATDSQLQQYYNVTATGSAYSPIPSLKAGDRIALAADAAGVSGSYVLLPARYAMLPGAFLVSVKTSSDSVLSGAKPQADGSWLVAGTRLAVNADGSSTAYSQRPLTLELASSNVTAQRAKYVTTTASEFFYDTAGARLAGDAGQLTVIGRNTLAFDPAIVAMRQAEIAAADGRTRAGRGLELDLAAPKLLIADAGGAPDASWSLLDQNKLNALGASSLLLGGVRTSDGATTRIDTIADKVDVRNTGVANANNALVGPEILLTAKDQLTVSAASRIEAGGDTSTERSVALNGDGAFLRVAAGTQATVAREGTVSRTRGDLMLEAGATVAGQALVFDATRGNTLSGTVALGTLQGDGSRSGGYLTIGAGRINIVGDGSTPTDGLTLDNANLARFALADQLRLSSYTTLDLYGDAVLGTAGLKELVIAAAGIAGHGGSDSIAQLRARSLLFENPNVDSASFTAGAALGGGALQVVADTIRFGGNATTTMRTAETAGFALRGFDAVSLQAAGDLRFEGRGVTAIDNVGGSGTAATLAISAARVVTVDTADHLLVASGGGSIAASGGAAGGSAGLGGAMELRAKSIDVTGRIEAAAGKLTLAATGIEVDGSGNGINHVTLGDGAVIAAEGVKVAFADTAAYAPGGQIVLRAAKGNVDVQDGAVVSVSGAVEGGDAGRLKLEAQEGTVSAAAGSLRAAASSADSSARRGELTVDAKAMALDTLAAAVTQTTADGTLTHFTGSWDVRRRNGDLNLSQTIKAADVVLAADNGGVAVSATGKIDASGAKGGSIKLHARNGDVNLAGRLEAKAMEKIDTTSNAGTRGQGGTVVLAADGTGKVITAAGSTIDVGVADGSLANGGKVNFRARKSASIANASDLNIQLAGGIAGASDVGAEIVSNYTGTSLIAGNTSGTTLGLTGTTSSIKKDLDTLYSAANMGTLRTHLGFDSALYHVRPGVEIASSSTADFNVGVTATDLNFSALRFQGEAGVLTVRAQGNLNINGTLTDGFVVNTPNTAVSRDAKLATSGQSWSYRLVAGADTAAASPLATKATATTGSIVLAANKLVRTGTGNIDLAARRDIKLLDRAAIFTAGVAASTHPTGFSAISGGSSQAAISSIFPDGGGDLSLTAGERIVMTKDATAGGTETTPDLRHINEWLFRAGGLSRNEQWWPRIASFQQGVAAFGGGDITLAAGTEIKNFTAVIPTNGRVPTIGGQRQPDLAVVQGGGDLTVGAGGTVAGGLFYAETGLLRIDAAALAADVGIALGDTTARIAVKGDAALGNVFNPMWVIANKYVVNSGTASVVNMSDNFEYRLRIGTYGNASALDLVSVTGNVALNASDSFYGFSDPYAHRLAPSHVKVVALNGDIAGSFAQAPGENGQLDLLAAGNITLGGNGVKQLDFSDAALPSVRNPIKDLNFVGLLGLLNGTPIERHSATGWHGSDAESSRLIALAGNITGVQGESNFAEFNEQVRIEAGGNITDLSVVAQHAKSSDVSIVAAGGNVEYNINGGLFPSRGISLGGPGRLEVTAGGNIDLGDSQGIVTRGNLDNPYLPESGASIFALAGATPDYAAFRNYLKVGSEVSDPMLRDRFYTLLRDFGREAEAGGGEPSYESGRAAIGALFPQANIKGGDINLFASQIKTEQGGDVDLLTPGGSIVVGVADPVIKKKSAVQGLFTLRDGDIRAYVKNNFMVNQSRVFTLDGGNILVWADQGSIDAGSGAKTVSSTPPPALVIRNGQIVLDTSNSVSGSGIGVLASRDDTPVSDMDLFAPQGAIDAGDAGLRSTGNITLGARTILNSSNIQAGGAVAGAPAPVAAPAPAAPAPPPAAADKGEAAAATSAGNRDARQGILTVEVLGDTLDSAATASAANRETRQDLLTVEMLDDEDDPKAKKKKKKKKKDEDEDEDTKE